MRFAAVAAAAAAADCPTAAAAAAANNGLPEALIVHPSEDTEDAPSTATEGLQLPPAARRALPSWANTVPGKARKWPLVHCSQAEDDGFVSACSDYASSSPHHQQSQQQQHRRRDQTYSCSRTPTNGEEDAISDGESVPLSLSSASTPHTLGTPSSSSRAPTSSSPRRAPHLSYFSPASPQGGRDLLQSRQETGKSRSTGGSIDLCCSCYQGSEASAEAGHVAAEARVAAAAATVASEGTRGILSTRICLTNAIGVLTSWFRAPLLLQGYNKLACDGLRTLLLLLLRLQRQQLLFRCQDLMEKYTHTISGGLLLAERHNVRTADGYEIHFYKLRKVTRCCCSSGCACATLGFTTGTVDVLQAAAAAAAAAVAQVAAPNISSNSSIESLSNDCCKGQVFFFVHGLLESSLNWISGGWLSLPFIVAARGGEVWLANSRGNEYSRPLKQKQERQQASSTRASQPCQAHVSGQVEDKRPNGYSIHTLHALIAEQHQRLLDLKQQQGDSRATQRHFRRLQQETTAEEEECCSLFCCRCSGLTSHPCLEGKPLEERLRLLQKACIDASAWLLRFQRAPRDAFDIPALRDVPQQKQSTDPRVDVRLTSLLLRSGDGKTAYAAKLRGTAASLPTAATPESTPTCWPGAGIPGAPHRSDTLKALSADDLADSARTGSTRCSSYRLPNSFNCSGELLQQMEDEAVAAAGSPGRLFSEQSSDTSLSCDTAESDSTDTGVCSSSCCWEYGLRNSRSGSCNDQKRRRRHGICSGKNGDLPPFEFCMDSAEGRWSFHEMALFDCPAQLQYVAMNSPVLRGRRFALFAGAAAFKGSDNSESSDSPFGCGLVAVGQSQGAAQLLVAFSTSPSLALLASRMVLFSPPLILQPLQKLPRAALLLLRCGQRHPAVLLKILRSFVRFIPGKVLAFIGDAVVGTGRSGSMKFYSTPLQSEQLALNFAHTPSGGTSRQNFAHWLQQLQGGQPLGTLAEPRIVSGNDAMQGHEDVLFQEAVQSSGSAQEAQGHLPAKQKRDKVVFSKRRVKLPEVQIPKGRYPLERINSEIYAFIGLHDNLVDAAATATYLQSCIHKERLNLHMLSGFGHLDFGWGRDRANDLYPELLARVAKCHAPSECGCGDRT